MNQYDNKFNKLVQEIVIEASQLNAKHTNQSKAPVNYVCIFSQNIDEYEGFIKTINHLGSVVQETAMGPVFYIKPISTAAGPVQLLKIRLPDTKRKEKGDADFTVADYKHFKDTYLGKPGFGIITREKMEMIELIDPNFNVIAYYSHPILAEVLNLQIK